MLLSDYAKGVLTARVIRHVIDAARKLGKPVIVDPKNANFAIYRGATLLTPNRKGICRGDAPPHPVRRGYRGSRGRSAALADAEAILVTRSEHGMTLAPRDGNPIHVPAQPAKVRDLSGAGDTVAAVLAVTLAARAGWEDALRCGHGGGGGRGRQARHRDGFAGRAATQILPAASLTAEEKIVARHRRSRCRRLAEWREQGQRIGFTNGCFDILHPRPCPGSDRRLARPAIA